MRVYLISLLLIGCQSFRSTEPIPAPPEMDEIISEVESSTTLAKADPEIQTKIVQKLRESNDYNIQSYNKILELESRLDKLEAENQRLKAENQELKDELATWRGIKTALAFTVLGLIGIGLMGFVIKFRKFFGSPI